MQNMKNYLKADGNRTVGISIEVDLFKEGDYIVAYCAALELSSFGKDKVEARKNFEEALNIFIEETHTRGTLENVLLDLGWSLRKKPTAIYTPPTQRTKPQRLEQQRFEERVLLPI
jgi:predicted RNase H-like HicB family nuclease